MKRLAVAFLLSSACAGCGKVALPSWLGSGPAGPRGSVGASPKQAGAAARPAERPAERQVYLVRLRMASIEVPVGSASGSEDIWSYVDEEPVAAEHAAVLGLNGLRIGLGRQDHWADLARVFQKLTGREVKQSGMMTRPGDPVPVVLKEHQPAQTIFTFYRDQTLSGADFPPGDNLLTIACTLDPEDTSKVLVTGMPQIRSTHRENRIVTEPAGVAMMVARPVVYPFTPLTFQFPVSRHDFVLIGPGAEARRPNSVGRQFLLKQKEGMEFETLVVLVPEAVAAQVR